MYLKKTSAIAWKLIIFLFIFSSCKTNKTNVDLILVNGVVYTVDSSFTTAESFAVKDGKFVAIGKNDEIAANYEAKNTIDAKGMAVYPGFIDSHCHFYGYGKGLQEVDLRGTTSFDEVLKRLEKFSTTDNAEWIVGRGWDQNDWEIKDFPNKLQLDKMFPNTPVILTRIDGHAALVNNKALEQSGISSSTQISGGVIEMKNKQLTGILVDNAVTLVQNALPKMSAESIKKALLDAQQKCFEVGLTTVDDAGLDKGVVDVIDALQKSNELQMRIYAMLSDNKENMDYYLNHGIYKTDRLNVRSFKFYADGALGSRGACLIQPYTDKPHERGFLLNNPAHFDSAAVVLAAKGFQMNTHCIGDSSVRLILNTYKAALSAPGIKDDSIRRWRLEHFQVTTAADMITLSKLPKGQVIPSVQPTHATSDMYWLKNRLGEKRAPYAYAYNDLLKASGMLALGTDFPVENINPLYTFYAAVARKDLKGFPKDGFEMENALTRENTLRGMTIWGAFANFEDKEKGSIEKGKFADFVVLDNDIMKAEISTVPTTKILKTVVNGVSVYGKSE